jgi:CHAT domain-containing protein
VSLEARSVVRTSDSPEGVLEGEILLDSAFTRKSFSDSLSSQAPVVHVASHFLLVPGSVSDTSLLLGDGSSLSLRDIRRDPSLDFKGLDLLTLSACETASGGRTGDGREVESFGEIVQRRGASSVMASLWKVDDLSTARLMREFYLLRYVEGWGKAEALQGAQLAIMKEAGETVGAGVIASGAPVTPGASGASGSPGSAEFSASPESSEQAPASSDASAPETGAAMADTERGSAVAGVAGAAEVAGTESPWAGRGWSHPYYWAPFVIMGDWR